MTTKIAVCGACGRMGQMIIKTVFKEDDLEVIAAIDRTEAPEKGTDIGELIGEGSLGIQITGSDELDSTLRRSKPEVLVDFTVAKAAVKNVKTAAKENIPVIVGTTGFSEEQRREMKDEIEREGIPAIISSNMSVGVNVFFELIEEAAEKLKGYDIELIETHHNQKVDSPSGTALTAAKIAAKATGEKFEEVAKFGRPEGKIGKRSKEEIGIHSIRAGGIAGEHDMIFASPNERLILRHVAESRKAFVDGVIRAIRYLGENGKKGKIQDMRDILRE